MKTFISKSLLDTASIAKEILADLGGVNVILFQGELGSGKTAFAKCVAENLDVDEVVTSPTFVIMKVYKIFNQKFDRLVHVDLYRLDNVDSTQLIELGLKEFIEDEKSLVLIEWPERLQQEIQGAMKIDFEIQDNNREIIVTK